MSLRSPRCAVVGLAATVLLSLPAAALADPPSNDDRESPRVLSKLPAQVTGTTRDATREPTDPSSACDAGGPQVWYSFIAPADGRIVVRLVADGDLDAILDAYLSERSQTSSLACDVTDPQGLGAMDFDVKKGSEYRIAVSMRTNSAAGDFMMTVVQADPAERPPGTRLPATGADGTLDRVGNVDDAYWVRMRAGRTYRLRLSGRSEDECNITARLFAPGPSSFDSASVKRLGCDSSGYTTYTPGPGKGGRYSVLVSAAHSTRSLQRYHLESAGAGPDDLAPGRFLGNHRTATGRLNGSRVDALDLYRFTIARRSDTTLKLTGGFELIVLSDRGRQLDEGTGELRLKLKAGRYFVAVKARGREKGAFSLRRTSKVITRTTVGWSDGRAGLGRPLRIGVRIRPSVGGPFTVTIQRFDPLSGWLFYRLEHGRASRGHGAIGFTPPAIGRWRARATFDGTIGAGSSESGFSQVLVVGS